MAKVNAAITNPAAPVEVEIRVSKSGPDIFEEKRFDNLAALEAWFNPKRYHFLGASSNATSTNMTFDEIKRPPSAPAQRDTLDPYVRALAKKPDRTAGTYTVVASAITVNGAAYRSVKAAFEALDLPLNKHQKFRAELKKEGTKTFEHAGKKYVFKTAGAK